MNRWMPPAIGWLLGGLAGIGTVLFATLIGPCVHIAVRLLSSVPDAELQIWG